MPIIGLAGAAYGLYQSISSGIKADKAEKKLEAQANNFQPNASILDYYNKRLATYNANPYESVGYKQQKNQIDRNLATGINGIQNRRLGVGAIGGAVQQANDASAKAATISEQQNNANLSGLGSAAAMKANEQQKKFDLTYNLTAAKAGAEAAKQNTGISNLYGGLSNAAYWYGSEGNGGNGGNGNVWDNGINAGANAYKMPRQRATF